MSKSKFLISMSLLMALVVLSWGIDQGWAQSANGNKYRGGKLTAAEQKAAAKRAKDLGLQLGATSAPIPVPGDQDGPGGIPHYFGPYGNWAFSPLPKGSIGSITVDSPGSGYTTATVVTIDDAYGTGACRLATTTFGSNGAIATIAINPNFAGGTGYTAPVVTIKDPTGSGANVTATFTPGGAITGFLLNPPGGTGSGYTAPVVTITDLTGTCATATATVGPGGAITGVAIANGPVTTYSAPVVTITDPIGTGAAATANLTGLTSGLRKFVDSLPGLGPLNANTLGQYIPVAVAGHSWLNNNGQTVPDSNTDYYEIALVEYSEQMHRDLPATGTRLRGYVQLSTTDVPGNQIPLYYANGAPIYYPGTSTHVKAVDKPHYLGPVIVAQGRVHGIEAANPAAGKAKPVRIKFYNLLPTGSGGDLFIPVDETVTGAGIGPSVPLIGGTRASLPGETYTQNRAAVHLHGNNTVWISDGNVHQWITPAGEDTAYPKGVTVRNVPDMQDPGPGAMTLFYTNAQSARLQFYHDHSMGITRLNVYAGEAGGYVITDAVEQDMIKGTNLTGVNIPKVVTPVPGTPGNYLQVLPDTGIPLIIQDRTFVDATTILAQDPTWNWGTGPRYPIVAGDPKSGLIQRGVTGDLWYPHVYMMVQNPWDLTGTNAFGRWHYGPWFNPPTPVCVNGLPVGCIEVGVVPNEYYDPINAPWEPLERPGLPNPSIPGESFLDTQLVNGTAYPYLEVEPKAYRFRVLNASNDRMVNLQLYVADPAVTTADGRTNTEVKMVPVSTAPANQYGDTPSGIPDPTTKGPDWIQIGTEGGFMPKPVVVPQQPIGYNLDPAFFNFGVVNQHSLWLGSAERADVVVDFGAKDANGNSLYAGKTLILYNDSPAPVPAGAAPYDFYTGNANQMDAGGAPTTQPGYGPNTRTIMQIRVGTTVSTPTTDVTLANLEAVFAKGPNGSTKRGVFEVSQDPIIIPQAAYNSAYANTFPADASQYVQIADTQKTFRPINEAGQLQAPVTLPLEPKGMHDEMGGVYDTLFGRMSGMLGLTPMTLPAPNPARPFILTPYGLGSPPTDIVKGSVEGTPIGVMPDGTQIWRIFHNGVDTHPIHVHLFTAQLISRVGQDGQWYNTDRVDPTELGWKETIKVNPLEITYLALRPTVPTPAQLPFEVPDSVRLIDPTLPLGATLIPPPPAGWFDPDGVAITEILNHEVNFGWEYVWHCHILSHEEMDMMHSLVYAVPPRAPSGLVATAVPQGNNFRVNLNWTDNSIKETGFTIQRATNNTFTQGLTTFNAPLAAGSGTTVAFTDTTVASNTSYWFRVWAIGPTVGDTQAYPGSLGFPTMSADSVSNTYQVLVGTAPTTPANPTNLVATLQAGPQVSLTWRDNATNETGFVVERCTGVGCTNFAQIATPGPRNNTGNVTYVDTTVTYGNSYSYRVKAVANAVSSLSYTNTVNVTVPAIPAAPTNFTVTIGAKQGNNYPATLRWTDNASNESNFTIQRATNSTFTTGLSTFTAPANTNPVPATSTLTQSLSRNTTYYYRIRANNSIGGSSAWVNALPFPIRTGN